MSNRCLLFAASSLVHLVDSLGKKSLALWLKFMHHVPVWEVLLVVGIYVLGSLQVASWSLSPVL